jgi:hypothetical protein
MVWSISKFSGIFSAGLRSLGTMRSSHNYERFGTIAMSGFGFVCFLSINGQLLALSPIESWRQQYFGTTANSGDAADLADPDSDGLVNLVEYALGLDPTKPSTSTITQDVSTGFDRLTIPRNANAIDLSLTVQVSGDLSNPANWTANGTTVDQNTPTLLQVHDNTPLANGGPRFMRLMITDLVWTVPGSPTNLGATSGAARVTVSWTAPSGNGGTAIDGYRIDVYTGATFVKSVTASGSPNIVTGLTTASYPIGTIGQSYTFYVFAHNSVGYSAASAPISAVPKVSYIADNLRGIWNKTYPSGSCIGCHGGGGPSPNLADQAGAPPHDYSNATNEGTWIYQVPAHQVSGHHTSFQTFDTNSFEYQTLQRWLSDGNLQ